MKKHTKFLVVSLLFIFNTTHADDAQDFKNLCSYDQKWCGKIKNSDGTWVKPKKEIVQLLKELAPTIVKDAATLGVDPQAIAGAIMAENSLNVSISDDVQDILVRIGVADKGEILGKKFTYGLGQLNFGAAREGEDYSAKLEGRAPISDKELSDALLIPQKAIYYVGAVLRKCQDDYKKQGIDIADKPEILTTLYNLGGSGSKALELKKSGATPRPNYFGFFVHRYQSELSFLKKAPVSPTTIATTKIAIKSTSIKLDKTSGLPLPAPKELKLAFTKSVPLYSAPPTCDTHNDYGATNIKNKYSSMKAFSVTAVAEKEKSFQIIAPSIDCEANTWELIKLSSGETGWIKKDDLEKTTGQLLIAKSKCTTKVDNKCSAQLKEVLKERIIENTDPKSREIFVSPATVGKKAAFKNPDWECNRIVDEDSFGGSVPPPSGVTMSSGGGGYGPTIIAVTKKIGKPINTDDALKSTLKKIVQKQKEIEDFYKAPLSDPLNPYSTIQIDQFKLGIEKCANKQIYNLDSCQLDLKEVDKLLNAMPLTPRLTREDGLFIGANIQMIPIGAPFTPKDQVIAAMKSNPYGSGGGWMPGMGMYGGFGSVTLDAQYAFREGDEAMWKLEDVEQALKECDATLSELNSKISNSKNLDPNEKMAMSDGVRQIQSMFLKSMNDSVGILKSKPEAEKTKIWNEAQGEFVQVSKFCLSLNETFDLNPKKIYEQPALQNYNCFYRNLTVLENGPALMLKDIVKESLFSPGGIQMLSMQAGTAMNLFKFINLGLIPQNPMGGTYAPVPSAPVEVPPSYCPNKTAEMIEDLVKNNPCIGKVYIPDKWLLNRLNELGDKVVYKPFAEDDRFSFDMESTQCK